MSAAHRLAGIATLVDAARGGSLPAARSLVERYQGDLLAIAYLHAGDRAGAVDAAGRAFIAYFETLDTTDPEDDPLRYLAGLLGEALMRPPAALARSGAAERYQVDDERARLRNALTLLAPGERLALVLRDFTGLSAADLRGLPGIAREGEDPAVRLPAIRRRLAQAANLDDPAALPAGLRALAVEAPRMALWAELEPEVEAVFARRRRRSRTLALAAGGTVALLLLGLAALLVYGATRDGNGERQGALPDASLASQPAPTVAPTPTPPYQPDGDVPDRILYVEAPDSGGTRLGLYNPASGAAVVLPGSGPPAISPDGSVLLQLQTRREGERLSALLVAAASDTGEELWRTDVGPLAESGPNSAVFDMVVIGDMIYVASHDPDFRPNLLTLALVRLSDGALRDIWGLNFGLPLSGPAVTVELFGTPPAAEPVLTILARDGDADWTKVQQIALRNGATRIDSPPVEGLAETPGARLLTPDGRAIVTIPQGGPVESPAVSYLTLDTLTQGEIALPFDDDRATGPVEYVLSHDGRWLYALAPYLSRAAIIDLELRQVQRVIDLASARVPVPSGAELDAATLAERYGSRPAAISVGGRTLYALGPLEARAGGPSPVVWAIDTATWEIVEEQSVDGLAAGGAISLTVPGESGVYVYTQDAAHGALLLDAEGGASESSLPELAGHAVLGTLADLYRQTYGRSPAVGGTAPLDVRAFTTVPRVDLEVSPAGGPEGWSYALRVTLRDPATGEPVADVVPEDQRNPDPPAITATFRNGDERRVAVLGRTGPGVYAGLLDLDLPGSWDAVLSSGDPAAGGWSVSRLAAVEVLDTVTDSAGREYRLEPTSEPSPLVAGSLATLTVTFAPVNAGLVLPSSTIPSSLELSRSLPAALDMTLPDGSVTTLYRSGSTHYSAFARFPAPGVYFPTISYTNERGETVSVVIRIVVYAPE